MDTLETIFNRRSIRQYTDKQVTEDTLLTLLKAAMYAPSAVNKQPWHFIVFRDRKTMQQIIEVHPNASMLNQANVAILVCWDEHQQHDAGYGPVDCAAATQNILLAAQSMELGAVWIGIYPRSQRMEAIQRVFKLPVNIKGFAIVSLGYPAEQKAMPDRFDVAKIHYGKW